MLIMSHVNGDIGLEINFEKSYYEIPHPYHMRTKSNTIASHVDKPAATNLQIISIR